MRTSKDESHHVYVASFTTTALAAMPRRKTVPRQLRQQSLADFLNPTPLKANSSRDSTTRIKPRQAGRAAKSLPSRVPEPFDQSDGDSGVEAIHFEPKKRTSSDDDIDIQPSSPMRRRRAAGETESQTDGDISASSLSDIDMHTKRKPLSSKIKSTRARSPSTEITLPKRRRLAKGVRPPSPEEPDDLLLEVNEAGESRFESCGIPTNPGHRYHTVPLPSSPEADTVPTKPRKTEK
jgi:hypothetical protein